MNRLGSDLRDSESAPGLQLSSWQTDNLGVPGPSLVAFSPGVAGLRGPRWCGAETGRSDTYSAVAEQSWGDTETWLRGTELTCPSLGPTLRPVVVSRILGSGLGVALVSPPTLETEGRVGAGVGGIVAGVGPVRGTI